MAELKKQVKVIRNLKSEQCLVSIPKGFWYLIPKSGYFEMSEQNGSLLLTPTQKKSTTTGIKMPVFDGDYSSEPASPQSSCEKNEPNDTKLNQIDPLKEPNVWEEDENESTSA